MEVINCKSCGKIFNYFAGEKLCQRCMKKLDEKFSQVKEYIYKNKGADIQEVAEECDVSISQIKKWVREERLEFTKDSLVGIDCESCGVSIRTGRFCNDCRSQLASDFQSLYTKEKDVTIKKGRISNDHRMRFLK